MRHFRLLGIALALAGGTPLVAAPPEPLQQPAKLLGLGAGLDRVFKNLADEGVTLSLSYYGVFQGNPVGGVTQETAYSHSIFVGVELNFEQLVCLPGASLLISGADGAGNNLSTSIGNINNVSEAYVTPTIMFYELYWKQRLFEDALELRFGRMAAASQFALLPAFVLQVSGGINSNPTSLFVNAPFTGTPNATWAASVKVRPAKETYAEAGAYQVTDRLGVPKYHGLDFSIRSNDGLLVMAQIGWEPAFCGAPDGTISDKDGKQTGISGEPGFPGIYLLGGYYSHWKFAELNGPGTVNDAYGFYVMGQQMLWRSANDPYTNFSVWGGITYSPQQRISRLPVMGFAGTIWQGIIPRRDRDQLLLTYLASEFSKDYGDSVLAAGGWRPTVEHVLEMSYAIYITDNYTVQPDLQYVIRPGGAGNIKDALVLGIQFSANF
jgi:porin